MALDGVKNFSKVTVSTGYDASATSIVLSSGHGAKLPDPATANYNLVWWDSTNYVSPEDDPNVEIVRCTAKSTDTLTVTRAQESTSATTKNTGGATYKMILGVTAKMITDIASVVNNTSDTNIDSFHKIALSFDGLNNSTTITDLVGNTWTARGDAKLSTSAKKNGISSLTLDGTGDYVDTPDSSAFTLGSKNFTAECWIKRAATGAAHWIFGQCNSAGQTVATSIALQINASDKIVGVLASGSTWNEIIGATSVDTNWHHIIFQRVGSYLYLYLDGALEGSLYIGGASANDSSNSFSVGRLGEYTGNPFNGNIDSFMLSVGVARYDLVDPILNAFKSANETVNNSSTYQDDNHLTLDVRASTSYIFELLLFVVTDSTGKFKYQFTAPSGTVVTNGQNFYGTTAAGSYSSASFGTALTNCLSGNPQFNDAFVLAKGIITTSTTAGTLTLQWAQSVANASNCLVAAGSYLKLTRI